MLYHRNNLHLINMLSLVKLADSHLKCNSLKLTFNPCRFCQAALFCWPDRPEYQYFIRPVDNQMLAE